MTVLLQDNVDTGRRTLYRLAATVPPDRGDGWSAQTIMAYLKASFEAVDRRDFPAEVFRECLVRFEDDGRLGLYVELHDTHPLYRAQDNGDG